MVRLEAEVREKLMVAAVGVPRLVVEVGAWVCRLVEVVAAASSPCCFQGQSKSVPTFLQDLSVDAAC